MKIIVGKGHDLAKGQLGGHEVKTFVKERTIVEHTIPGTCGVHGCSALSGEACFQRSGGRGAAGGERIL